MLLEREGPVQAASVNLATETAVVRVVLPSGSNGSAAAAAAGAGERAAPAAAAAAAAAAPEDGAAAAADGDGDAGAGSDLEAGLSPHDRHLASMGASLARMLTDAGYAATMRQQGGGSSASGKVVAAKREERMRRLRWVAGRMRECSIAWQVLAEHAPLLMLMAPAGLQGDHPPAGRGLAAGLCLSAAPPDALAGRRRALLAAPAGKHAGARLAGGTGAAW